MRTGILLTTILITSLTAGFLSGCTTPNSALGPEVAAKPAFDISKGSSTESLIELLGEPLRIDHGKNDAPVPIEIWVYEIEKSETDMVAFETHDVPFVDPITGELKMIQEPLYSPQTITNTDTIQVFIVEEKVVGWKVERNERREVSK